MFKNLIILFGILCPLTYSCQSVESTDAFPNILIILADDLGYGDVSYYEEDNKIKTPNIDRIGHEGLQFTDAHTPSAVCTPTRYGLLTGRYSWRSRLKQGVLTGKSPALIPNSRSTIASILQSKGYHTAFIGKWHLGWDWGMKEAVDTTGAGWNKSDFTNLDFTKPVLNTPNDLGFTYSYGHSGSLDMAPYVYVENRRPTAVPDRTTVNTGTYSWWREGPTASDFIHEDVTPNFFRRAIQYIETQSSQAEPFFLYLALPSPHTPILPTAEWQGKSGLNPYGDFMLMIDNYVGQLLNTLENRGIQDNTIVIFTSDNGCSPAAKIDELMAEGHYPNGHFRGHKADIYEGGHRVPFLIKWPHKISKGSRSNETICLTDLMATMAKIIDYDLKENEGEDSYDLNPIWDNPDYTAPIREATVHHSINGSFAIRKDNWKLIMCPGSGGWSYPTPADVAQLDTLYPVQLYNLAQDAMEQYNLATARPDKVDSLQQLLISYIREGRSTPGVAQKNDSISTPWKQIAFIDQ